MPEHIDRTDRVSSESKFGTAIKKTECAFTGRRENSLQVSQEQGSKVDIRMGHDTVALEIECNPERD